MTTMKRLVWTGPVQSSWSSPVRSSLVCLAQWSGQDQSGPVHSGLKYPTPAIGGLFYGVACGSGLGRASNTRSENKNLYLETDEFASTPPFKKKTFGGSYLRVKSAREHFSGNFFKKTFGGNFSKNI